MTDNHKPLAVPPSLPTDADAQEMIRFWIAGGTDYTSLHIGGAGKPGAEAPMWGFILADIAKHVVTAMRQQDPDGPSAQELMEQILGGLSERLKHSPHLQGTVQKVSE